MIRKAKMSDVRSIHALLTHFADLGLLLPRSLSQIYDHLRDYTVINDKDDAIAGVVALNICWEDLAEIRSLAVCEVEHCLREAVDFEIYKVFTLTYQTVFFKKLGFKPIDKGALPQKIWADCINCPKFPDCDESALLKVIYPPKF